MGPLKYDYIKVAVKIDRDYIKWFLIYYEICENSSDLKNLSVIATWWKIL